MYVVSAAVLNPSLAVRVERSQTEAQPIRSINAEDQQDD